MDARRCRRRIVRLANAPDLALPPPKRPRSRRLRKKLHIGEFQQLGFEYDLSWSVVPTIELQDQFLDALLEQLVKPRSLSLGGGLNCGFVSAHHGSVTGADRAAFEDWFHEWPCVDRVQVGPLRDAWYDVIP